VTASGPRREVFGYATAGSLADPTIGYASWNFNLLSTVAFFAIHVQYDGQLVGDSNFTVWSSSALTGLVNTAHAHGVKVVVTIVGPNNPVDLCDALYNGKRQTIPQLVQEVTRKGVDGVNIDYEGQLTQCQNVVDPTLNASNQTLLTNFARDMRAGLDAAKPGYYLSIATYSGSASGNDGFFNIPNLNQYVDSFFVMAYDMDAANQPYAPLNCSSFCMAPVSPLANYYWNDTTSMSQYSALVGPGKTILGQPYYGRVACVASPADHATATGSVAAATYVGAAAVSSSPDVQPGTFAAHRDDTDPNGLDRWDSWYDNSLHCWRVMHWSDATTLGVRYNLVNQMNLRGVGLWTLNYGGGSPELWTALQTYFNGCYSAAVSANPSSPVLAGASVMITATSGCPDPNPMYQLWVLAPGASSYQVLQPYSTNSTYTWNTAGLFPGVYRLAVWARDANSTGEFSNSLGTWDTSNVIPFTVTTNPCSAISLTIAPVGTANVGTAVGITARSSGCPSPLYQFWIMAPGTSSFTLAQAYSTTASYSLDTTNKAPGIYVFGIWARDASSPGTYGNTLGRWDASYATQYSVTTCTASSIGSAPPSPVTAGTSVTFTATATGCPNPSPVYQFWTLAPGASSWTAAQAYSTGNTLSWSTAGKAPGTYQVAIWARDASSGGAYGNSLGTWDVAASIAYKLSSTACTALSLSAAPPTTTTVGTPVTFTATGACPDANPVYQFWVLAPGASSWTIAQAYSTSNSLSWSTAGKAPGAYQVAVWARDANSGGTFSNSLGTWDVATSRSYTVTSCTGVGLSAVPASTTTVGTSVTFTATATGCPNPSPVYQFWVLAPGSSSWTVAQPYSTSNTLSWSTAGSAAGAYQVAVWTRDAGSGGAYSNSLGAWDVATSSSYTLK
jgi:spore germination protein YaaH